MVYEPLHHKYRPQTFGDLVGQEAITTTLSNALKRNRIAPAYLFTGPRGTGKTSSARILAKSLNCLKSEQPTPYPCGECEVCRAIARGSALDVIEIDAASNTGVDNIRELIERAQFAPVQCRYKVYVVDECLVGNTLVQTSQGLMRIDDPTLKGHKVLSYHEKSHTWEYKKVLRWLSQGEKLTITIRTQNSQIVCTENHLIRTEQGWIKAAQIKSGMKILSPHPVQKTKDYAEKKPTTTYTWGLKVHTYGLESCNNTPSPQWTTNLETVESVTISDVEKVYDIEVEDNHNFVANGLLVHNCHMLSTAAFNALLKTLEEPPERVIFVLATTDPQRVLPTIISRCQRFDYRRIPLDAMVSHLRTIADKEAIKIDPEALTLVAQIANGGLRDAESLLDQLSLLEGIVNPTKVWELVGAVPEQDLLTLICSLRSQETEAILDKSRHLMNRGREPLVILQNLANFYLNLLIAKTAPQRSDLVAVTAPTWQALCLEAQQWSIARILAGQQHLKESELQIKNTTQPRLWLEVTLLGLLTVPSNPNPAPTPANPAPTPTPTPANPAPTPTPGVEGDTIWEKILGQIQQMTTRSILRQHGTLVSLQDTVAYISLSSEALLKLVQPQLSVVEAAFASVCQHPVKVHLKLGEAPTTPPTEKPSPSPLPSPPPELEKPEVKPLPPINTEKKAPPPPPTAPPVPSINLDTDVQKAAANLAKYFDGEIVNLDYSPDPEPDDSPKVIILGRPKLEDVIDDDDLPF